MERLSSTYNWLSQQVIETYEKNCNHKKVVRNNLKNPHPISYHTSILLGLV